MARGQAARPLPRLLHLHRVLHRLRAYRPRPSLPARPALPAVAGLAACLAACAQAVGAVPAAVAAPAAAVVPAGPAALAVAGEAVALAVAAGAAAVAPAVAAVPVAGKPHCSSIQQHVDGARSHPHAIFMPRGRILPLRARPVQGARRLQGAPPTLLRPYVTGCASVFPRLDGASGRDWGHADAGRLFSGDTSRHVRLQAGCWWFPFAPMPFATGAATFAYIRRRAHTRPPTPGRRFRAGIGVHADGAPVSGSTSKQAARCTIRF